MNRPNFTPYKTLAIVLVLLFLLEAVVMAIINYLNLPALLEAVLDSSALILLAIPVLYALFIRPMIQQVQSTEQARKTIETMYETSLELSQNLDLQRVMDIVLKQVNVLFPVDFATLYLIDSPGQLMLRVSRGYKREAGEAGALAGGFDRSGHPALTGVINEQKSRIILDTTTIEDWPAPAGILSGGSWIGIPLMASGKVIGLCEFTHQQPGAFTRESLQLGERVVSQAAAAIQNASLYDQVRTSREQLQLLTHKIVTIQEHERRYLAKALYDEVGQSVLAVMFQLRRLEANGPLPAGVRGQVDELEKELAAVSKKMHDLANDLRPASLDFLGLESALKQYIDRLQERSPLTVHYQVDGLPDRLPEVTEIVLFRIAQEAITNVIRHARASTVTIHLQLHSAPLNSGPLDSGQLTMIIEDNGIGFSLEAVNLKQCVGLLDMRERAEMIGGKFTIESVPGVGTTVCVSVPVPGPA